MKRRRKNPRVKGRMYALEVYSYKNRTRVREVRVFQRLKDAVKAGRKLGKKWHGEITPTDLKRRVWSSAEPKVKAKRLRRSRKLVHTEKALKRGGWGAITPEPEHRERASKSRARFQKKHKKKPKRPRAAEQITTTRPEEYNRFMRLAKPVIEREGREVVIRSRAGKEVLRFPWYKGAEKDWSSLHEAGHGRVTKAAEERFKLKVIKGFKTEAVDGTYGRVTYSKRIYDNARGAVIGQSKGKPYVNRDGKLVDPKKYLGPMFDAMKPENWVDGIWRALPEYMRQKGDMSTWAIRMQVRDKGGRVETVQTTFRGTEDILKFKVWIELLAELANRAGPLLGYGMSGIAARARVVAVDILIGGEL